MKALVFAESEPAARELSAGARTLADEVTLVTFDDPVAGVADRVVTVTVPEGHPKEDALETFYQVYQDVQPDIVLVEPTRRLKTIAGRIAAREGASVITDAMALADGVATSMYFGGVGVRTAKAATPVTFVTVTPGAFADAEPSGTDAAEAVAFVEPAVPLTLVAREDLPPAEVDLTAAERVVAAGRGFAAEEQLGLARDFCQKIGAELGCTRPLTESETWFPREAYIGVSGLILNPEVYVGIGVSGQMQHMVGVDRAKVSFAINKDKNAPIFQQVDYGLVGDIADVLPKINVEL